MHRNYCSLALRHWYLGIIELMEYNKKNPEKLKLNNSLFHFKIFTYVQGNNSNVSLALLLFCAKKINNLACHASKASTNVKFGRNIVLLMLNSSDVGNWIWLWGSIPCLPMPWLLNSAEHWQAYGCVGQTTSIVVPELISSTCTWVKPNPRYDFKCE